MNKGRWTLCSIDPFLAQVCECGRAGAGMPMGEVLRPRPWASDIRYRYRPRFGDCLCGGFLRPPHRGVPNPEPRTLGKERVRRRTLTRSNLDRWEDCGEAPQGATLWACPIQGASGHEEGARERGRGRGQVDGRIRPRHPCRQPHGDSVGPSPSRRPQDAPDGPSSAQRTLGPSTRPPSHDGAPGRPGWP